MPEDFPPTGAVNLRLIATSPEQLAHLAEAEANRDGPEDASATGCNDQRTGPSAITPEQPGDAHDGLSIPKKEAPKPPLEGKSAQVALAGHPPASEKPQQSPDWFERIARPAPFSQTPLTRHPKILSVAPKLARTAES
jgi:hypothetical protein